MDISPQIFTARVMHKRLFPRVNAFTYRVYYLALPLPAAPVPGRLQGFSARDVGPRDGSDPQGWVKDILHKHGMHDAASQLMLVTMPRVLGYVFNPVSFYLCMDNDRRLRAVICEVHNTFGEYHSYLCAHADHRPIAGDDWLEAQKLFHVSPFLERTGHYRFRFHVASPQLGIWIDYYDADQRKQLLTSLTGKLAPLNRRSLAHAFWSHPLVTLRAIFLIHWQAIRLMAKGIRYIPKPAQLPETLSVSRDLTKM